jgi:hypothetical protein
MALKIKPFSVLSWMIWLYSQAVATMGCQPSDCIGIDLNLFVCATGGTPAANKEKGR